MDKPYIPYPIVVEGKYDKIKITSLFEADVFTTDGFGVFRREDKAAFFRKLSERTPLLILTDSDGAGLVIRKFFLSALPKDKQIHLYTPEIKGKERRKSAPSKSGRLGVEGIDAAILRDLLLPYAEQSSVSEKSGNGLSDEKKCDTGGISREKTVRAPAPRGTLTKADLYALGLSGREGSAERRTALALFLGFPSDISSGALISALNMLYSRDEIFDIIENFGD